MRNYLNVKVQVAVDFIKGERMNTQSFQSLVRGKYGRIVPYTTVEEITTENVASVVGKTLGTFLWNKRCAEYLWNYYLGDQPILYRRKTIRDDVNNPVVENHAYELVQFKNGQTYGEPITCVSLKKDAKINKAVDEYNNYCRASGKYTKDSACGEWQSATGFGYKAVQRAKGREIPFRVTVPTPLNTYVVYQKETQEPILAVQEVVGEDGKTYYKAYSEFLEFKLHKGELVNLSGDDNAPVYARPHVFGGIPIVEYPNNQSRTSDIEIVITMLDAINELQSNRVDAISQFVQSFFKFMNCDVDEEKFKAMKKLGAFVVNSSDDNKNADVDLVTQELNQEHSQIVKKDIWDNALTISAVPNREGNTGGDTQGAVELRNGWDFSQTRAKLKDMYVKDSERLLNGVILNVLRQENKKLDISVLDFESQVVHSPTDNLQVKAQSLKMLLDAGIHPLVAIKTVGLWSDAEKVFINSKDYLDVLYKTIDEEIENQNLTEQVDKANQLLNQQKDKVNNNENGEQ